MAQWADILFQILDNHFARQELCMGSPKWEIQFCWVQPKLGIWFCMDPPKWCAYGCVWSHLSFNTQSAPTRFLKLGMSAVF